MIAAQAVKPIATRSRVCLFEDCEGAVRSRGMCARHYYQMHHQGRLDEFPLPRANPRPKPVPESIQGERVVLVLSPSDALMLALAAQIQVEVLSRAAQHAGVMSPIHRARAETLAGMVAEIRSTARAAA